MTNKEIKKRLEGVIKQQRAYYQHNENLRISEEEAQEKLKERTGIIVHVGLHLLGGFSPEYTELNKFAFGEHQLSFEEYLYKEDENHEI
jgi:hypothetical protein